MDTTSKTTPKDFFLWLGAIIALYGSVSSLIALLFSYVDYSFPDPLAFPGDPYSGAMRFSMATIIVLVPATLALFRLIRGSIAEEPGKAQIWVRRWAIMLTIFIAVATVLIDLITIVNTFLSGELTERFLLKTVLVLLIALGLFFHFFADFKGYWIANPKKANLVGIATGVLAAASIIAGFFIIGTPTDARLMRFDAQKVSDLENIQYQIVSFWQQKEKFPVSLDELSDPLSGYAVPKDPETDAAYRYEVTGPLSFTLCATFNAKTPDTAGRGAYPGADIAYPSMYGGSDNWQHEAGETCFSRTIDPERYPPSRKPID